MDLFNDLKVRGKITYDALSKMKGITVSPNKLEASLYAFPQVTFSDAVLEDAKKMNLAPDTYFALQLLN